MTTESRDIVERLESWASSFSTSSPTDVALVADLREAISTITRLRSLCGKADVGQSFAEMTKDAKREVPYHEGAGGLPYRDA